MDSISVIEQEDLIKKYLDEGNRKAAVRLIYELVIACAKEKNFKAAESLRDRIFEIDPMALDEIIHSGEVIEQEKRDVIDKDHREIWAGLYDNLTVEEANALYFALKSESYPADTVIYSQGEHKPQLFFVNRGRLKIFYPQNNHEMLLKMLNRGQVAGEDTFFSSTICTTSMVTLTSSELCCLDADVLKRWRTEFPVLESKLQDFVSKFKRIKDLIRERELDRRCYKRIQAAGKGEAQLMSAAEAPIGKPFKVDVVDLSQGGAGFMVRITKRETASLLLGQNVNLRYTHPQAGPSKAIEQSGTIVAVRFHPLEDCSISVKFHQVLDPMLIDELGRLSPPPPEFNLS